MVTVERLPSFKDLMVKHLLFLFLPVFLLSVSSSAQQMLETDQTAVSEELQVPIFLKILTYDRSFEVEVKDTLQIGVLFFPGNESSQKNKDALIENLKLNQDKTVNGIPFHFHVIKFSTEKGLDDVTKEKRINILYVTSGGSNVPKDISQISRKKKILTITGRADYVRDGISVGLRVEQEKPQIVINLRSARAEGCDFSANLLRLCKVIDQESPSS